MTLALHLKHLHQQERQVPKHPEIQEQSFISLTDHKSKYIRYSGQNKNIVQQILALYLQDLHLMDKLIPILPAKVLSINISLTKKMKRKERKKKKTTCPEGFSFIK